MFWNSTDDFLRNFMNAHEAAQPAGHVIPLANLASTQSSIDIEVELPGFKREDISVEVGNGVLTIETKPQKKSHKYDRQEFGPRLYKRAWRLPKSADVDTVAAEYDAGILRLSIPVRKDAGAAARKVEIN